MSKCLLYRFFLPLAVLFSLLSITSALAGECQSNQFQPTFVRHNSIAPWVWYVEPGGGFTLMLNPDEAQITCRARGVRQTITRQNCRQRNWGDFGCGCNITPSPNVTCARFQAFVPTIRAENQYCRDLYAQGDRQNAAGNTARSAQNIAGARVNYAAALNSFTQGMNDRRCKRYRDQFANGAQIVQRNIQRVAGGAPQQNQFCARYARMAVTQNQQNIQRRCGYTGPVWQSDYGNHYRWCLTVSAATANAEEQRRVNGLNRCRQKPQNAFCARYASTAVDQNQENIRRRCGKSGPRWQSNYNNHYRWCTTTSQGSANYEETQRRNALNRCGR